MPSGGHGSSQIRVLTSAFTGRPISPRSERAHKPKLGEPIVQSDDAQNLLPIIGMSSGQRPEEQYDAMISVPAGGPNDGQRTVQYIQHAQPATSDAESRGSATTQTGEEEPAGCIPSDTEPTDPSPDKEAPAIATADNQSEAGDSHNGTGQTKSDQHKDKYKFRKVITMLKGLDSTSDLRHAAVPSHIQVQELLPNQSSPYGEGHSMELQAPVLDQAREAPGNSSAPSAPPAASDDQALQTQPFRDVEKPKSDQGASPGDQGSFSGSRQSETLSKETHVAQLATDQLPLLEHYARWEKVDLHARRPTPTDEDQVPHKQIKAASFGKQCDQDLRKTLEEGTFTVTCESTKVGVSKTVQGSPEGAWFLDAAEH